MRRLVFALVLVVSLVVPASAAFAGGVYVPPTTVVANPSCVINSSDGHSFVLSCVNVGLQTSLGAMWELVVVFFDPQLSEYVTVAVQNGSGAALPTSFSVVDNTYYTAVNNVSDIYPVTSSQVIVNGNAQTSGICQSASGHPWGLHDAGGVSIEAVCWGGAAANPADISFYDNSGSANGLTESYMPASGSSTTVTSLGSVDVGSGFASGSLAEGTPNSGLYSGCSLVSIEAPDPSSVSPVPPSGGSPTEYLASIGVYGGSDAVVAVDAGGPTTGSSSTLYGDVFGGSSGTQPGWLAGQVESPTGLPGTVVLPFTPSPGTQVDPTFWCHWGTASAGGWVDWGPLSGMSVATVAPDGGSTTPRNPLMGSSCLAVLTGWSLANPIEWVVGGLTDLGCLIRHYTIPSLYSASNPYGIDWSALSSDLQTKEPISYLTSAISDTTALLNAVNSTAAACTAPSFSFPSFSGSSGFAGFMSRIHSQDFTVSLPVPPSCSGAPAELTASVGGSSVSAGNLFGYASLIRSVMAFGVWLTFLAVAWGMMPWSQPLDGVAGLFGGGGSVSAVDGEVVWSPVVGQSALGGGDGVIDAESPDDVRELGPG